MNNEIDEILAYLEYIRTQNRLVSVVSSFKGVSYSMIVNIIKLESKGKSITISTQHRQNMSLLPNIIVDVHSDLFPFTVYANVSEVDPQRKSAVLNKFEYKRDVNENRSQVRVQPGKTIPITITCENAIQYSTQILDISIKGIAVIFNDKPDDIEEAIYKDKPVRLNFNIPQGDPSAYHTLSLQSKVIYATVVDGGKYRIGMEIFPTLDEQASLRRYIFDQQTELYQEITSQ